MLPQPKMMTIFSQHEMCISGISCSLIYNCKSFCLSQAPDTFALLCCITLAGNRKCPWNKKELEIYLKNTVMNWSVRHRQLSSRWYCVSMWYKVFGVGAVPSSSSSRGHTLRMAGVLSCRIGVQQERWSSAWLCSSHTALTLQMSPPQKYPNTSTWKGEGTAFCGAAF